ncbi:MAG: bifunctional DNA-formamidopyrimidine glycosylase/DNA-(apurinic or apyrimidinic site) lyase, partial [Deltaproteobacteria bacterium]
VSRVDVACASLRRPLDPDFGRRLKGRRIERIGRRAKYLVFDLDDGLSWIVHLGMSGRLVYRQPSDPAARDRHDHVVVHLGRHGRLVFNDARRFGLMTVEAAAGCDLFARLGPDALDQDGFNAAHLTALKRHTRRSLKDVLMDQAVVAGLGNIYVNEILFAAGLRPRRRLQRTSRAQLERLVAATREVLAEAIEHRGSSISDFLDGIGRKGGYQWRRRVYDRADQPCPRCRTLIKAVVVGQRSSFYCPRCQS